MNEILITTVISSICTGGITWLFTLKYTRKQAEADAMLSVQNVYQQIIEDLKTDRVELKENIKELALKVSENEREIKAMKPNLCGRKACTQRIQSINYMKKYALYIVLSGVFLASCSRTTIDHRKTNETVLSDSVKALTDTREEQDKQQGHSTERNTRTDEENRVVIKFDTEKPVTKETGLPPIKEISFTGSTTNQKKEVYTEIDTEKNIKSVISDSTAVNRKTDKKEDIKTSKEIKPSTNLWKTLLYICLIVFSYYLFDVLRAHWPKIKQLWRRVFKL